MATVSLISYPVSSPHPSLRFLCEAWWSCYSSPPHTWRIRSDLLVATGEAFSVIPPAIRELLDMEIRPAGFTPNDEPHWQGVPCRFGRITVWLPNADVPGRLQEFSLLAMLPQRDVPTALPFVLLGMQFFTEHRGNIALDCSMSPGKGMFAVP